jgi:hypothetical protein
MKLSRVCDIFDQHCDGILFCLKTNNGYSGAPGGMQSDDGPPSSVDDNNLCCGELPLPPQPTLVNIETALRPSLYEARSPFYVYYLVFLITEQM